MTIVFFFFRFFFGSCSLCVDDRRSGARLRDRKSGVEGAANWSRQPVSVTCRAQGRHWLRDPRRTARVSVLDATWSSSCGL